MIGPPVISFLLSPWRDRDCILHHRNRIIMTSLKLIWSCESTLHLPSLLTNIGLILEHIIHDVIAMLSVAQIYSHQQLGTSCPLGTILATVIPAHPGSTSPPDNARSLMIECPTLWFSPRMPFLSMLLSYGLTNMNHSITMESSFWWCTATISCNVDCREDR